MDNNSLFIFSLVVFSFLSLVTSYSTYETFLSCLSNHTGSKEASSIVHTPNDPSYTNVLQSYIRNSRFNRSKTPKPVIIVTPTDPTHVQATVVCAKYIGIQLKIRSGGHDYEGTSYVSNVPFVVLDMFGLRSITIDTSAQTAWVQAGALLGELYYKIATSSKVHAFPGGVCSTVGAGGHISGGGYGNLIRKHSLAVDHVIDALIVDVNGRVLNRKDMGEDLFWAIRGGGGASFCVILAYKIELVQVPETVTVFRIKKTLEENATDIIHKWQYVASEIDDDLFIRLNLDPVLLENKGERGIVASFVTLFVGDAERLIRLVNDGFPELGLKAEDCTEMNWIESVLYWANFPKGTPIDMLIKRTISSTHFLKKKSDYVQTPISKDGLEVIFKKMIELGNVGLSFNPYGGRMSEIPENETAFPHRAGNLYNIQYTTNWVEDGIDAENDYINRTRMLYDYMTPYVSKSPRGAFLNYRDFDIGTNDHGNDGYVQGKVYGEKYFKGNFVRLVKIKTMVDPGNFFRNEQSIPTLQP